MSIEEIGVVTTPTGEFVKIQYHTEYSGYWHDVTTITASKEYKEKQEYDKRCEEHSKSMKESIRRHNEAQYEKLKKELGK